MSNEKRLIDANALIDDWNKAIKRMVRDSDGKVPIDFGLVICEISKAPTVDAVEVVRCKDCKYAMDMMPIQNSGCLMGECTLRKEDDIVFMAFGDDFCSYGEIKEK